MGANLLCEKRKKMQAELLSLIVSNYNRVDCWTDTKINIDNTIWNPLLREVLSQLAHRNPVTSSVLVSQLFFVINLNLQVINLYKKERVVNIYVKPLNTLLYYFPT